MKWMNIYPAVGSWYFNLWTRKKVLNDCWKQRNLKGYLPFKNDFEHIDGSNSSFIVNWGLSDDLFGYWILNTLVNMSVDSDAHGIDFTQNILITLILLSIKDKISCP